jgi:hypothetical protein
MGYDVINCLQLDNLTAIVLELELEFNTQCPSVITLNNMDMDLLVLNISRHMSLYHYIISENIQLSLILWVMAILVQEDHVVIPR